MKVEECFDKGILRKIAPDKNKSDNSFKISENKLMRARELISKDFFEEALISAYTSMFHASRAILYKDGIQEKSHFAIYIYLKEKYSDKFDKSFIEAFRNYQLERHEIIYGFDREVTKEKSESCIENAELFIQEVKKLL